MLLSNGLIGLRDGLEATVAVSILTAFLVRTGRRWALGPVGAGAISAVAVSMSVAGIFAQVLGYLDFQQEEAIDGLASIVAAASLTWMIFWLRHASRPTAKPYVPLPGTRPRAGAVAGVAFLAVAHEGLQTAADFFSPVESADAGTAQPVVGFVAGGALAVALAWLLCRGAIRLAPSTFPMAAGVLLVLIAAGFLSYGVHDLQEGSVLPGLRSLAFDLGPQLPPDSWYGALLRGIFSLSPIMTVPQAVAWLIYVAIALPAFLAPSVPVHLREAPTRSHPTAHG